MVVPVLTHPSPSAMRCRTCSRPGLRLGNPSVALRRHSRSACRPSRRPATTDTFRCRDSLHATKVCNYSSLLTLSALAIYLIGGAVQRIAQDDAAAEGCVLPKVSP